MKHHLKSEQFLNSVRGHRQAIVLTHDNPDPDAIGSGWALKALIEVRLGIPSRLVAGGAIIRAENRRMMQVLNPPLELLDNVHPTAGTALVFVDCQPQGASNLLDGGDYDIAAVIDHHSRTNAEPCASHCDIRPGVVAAGTIVTQYLREQDVQPAPELATALVYAIQTDARSAAAKPSRADRSALSWLVSLADLDKLAEITNAPLEPSYFLDLAMALESTLQFGNAALCFLPSAHGPEVVGEFADLLIRCRTIDRILCAAVFEGDLLVSVRTTDAGGDACELIRRTLAGLGNGGGHEHRAGGKIPGPIPSDRITPDLRSELCRRWLGACGVAAARPFPLVPPPDSDARPELEVVGAGCGKN